MQFQAFSFGSIRIDGVTYEHDVVIEGGVVRKRRKKRSKKYQEAFGHTPLSIEEKIPWKCKRLVVGTGTGGARVRPGVDEHIGAADPGESDFDQSVSGSDHRLRDVLAANLFFRPVANNLHRLHLLGNAG
jgi:hypothetical protein